MSPAGTEHPHTGTAVASSVEKACGPILSMENLSKRFHVNGADVPALENICLGVETGELVCILGPSGCGKSTLLNLIAGFIRPDSGALLFRGSAITGPGPDRCVVFQEDALLPWLTVGENIGFGLKGRRVPTHVKKERVDRFLDLVGLAPYRDYLPREISGGMKQRVALARVLVLHPEILLMDEPFAALDAQTRERMQALLLSLWQALGHTIVFVTHDVREAVALADRVMVMGRSPGNFSAAVKVDLARPRDEDDPAFARYVKRLKTLVAAS